MDAGTQARKAAQRHGFQGVPKAFPAGGGRSVDVEVRSRHAERCQKGLISRNFTKPSDGLEPSTPSLPFQAAAAAGRRWLAASFSLHSVWFVCNEHPFLERSRPALNDPELVPRTCPQNVALGAGCVAVLWHRCESRAAQPATRPSGPLSQTSLRRTARRPG